METYLWYTCWLLVYCASVRAWEIRNIESASTRGENRWIAEDEEEDEDIRENSVPHHRSESAAISGELGACMWMDASAGDVHDGVLCFIFFFSNFFLDNEKSQE